MSGRKIIPFGQRRTANFNADTHLALARCQNAGTAFWEFYINFKRINISAYFFCSFLRPKYDKIGYTDNPKVGFLSEIQEKIVGICSSKN